MSDDKPVEPSTEVAELEPILEKLPASQREKIRQILVQYQGPLPHPAMMEEYARLIPNAPERLMALLEQQTAHRISIESTLVTSKDSLTKRGQWFAFVLSVFFGAITVVLALNGQPVVAGSIGVTTIVGLAVVFVLGREPGQRTPAPPSPKSPTTAKASTSRKKGGR